MKIISLNTWGGRAGKEDLLAFFERHKDVDIFCLQEMWSAPYSSYDGHSAGGMPINHDNIMVYGVKELTELLPDHEPFFRPHFLDNYGLMMLVKKDIKIFEEGEIYVYKHKGYIPEGDLGNHARNIQYVTLEHEEGRMTVINFHGLWNGKGKGDSDDRIQQTKNILDFSQKLSDNVIICGDFNLLPGTESVRLFEEAGFRNLVTETGVTSTRTKFYEKPEKFADYIFTSKYIDIKEFKVLPDEVSDHAPLFLIV